ncbi:MAG TPA: FkbM family methyltransferase [Opitutaceae bacterium]|nr:FkbM family methyltransferase [Opitutaceae bacterium]
MGKIDTLRRILRHARHLGPSGGWQAARMIAGRDRLVRLRVRGLPQPIWVRAGTADVETFEEIFLARHYELPFPEFHPRFVLDLGANIGLASIRFAARWPAARILAVEPAEENFALLQRNTGAYPMIARDRAAVWAHAAELAILNPGDAANAFRLGTAAAGPAAAAVPGRTIDEFATRFGCGAWNLVKMDVEGAEAEILNANTRWLDAVSVLVIELHDRICPGCTEALCSALRDRRFRMEIVGANLAFDFR